jgi:4-amino-4-deoxy-L-arabinose transferase-like glycosyltransferase
MLDHHTLSHCRMCDCARANRWVLLTLCGVALALAALYQLSAVLTVVLLLGVPVYVVGVEEMWKASSRFHSASGAVCVKVCQCGTLVFSAHLGVPADAVSA